MCIIIAKSSGIEMPTEEVLNNCFTSNRDGIGFAFNKPGEKVIITKGFANVKKLQNMLKIFDIGPEHNLLIHFRLATHGMKDRRNCHPFPLTPSLERMRDLHLSCNTAITHNGVFGGMKTSDKYSDTMKFIGTILASPEIIANLGSPSVGELIRGYCGHSSKLAFLQPSGITTIGDFEEDNGIKYSNLQYKSWTSRTTHDYGYTAGTKYCQEHKEYDKCHETRDKESEWCYRHGKYDFCVWCIEHRELDDCAHKAKLNSSCCPSDIPNILDLRLLRCEWCNETKDVRYSVDMDANVCDGCIALYAGAH